MHSALRRKDLNIILAIGVSKQQSSAWRFVSFLKFISIHKEKNVEWKIIHQSIFTQLLSFLLNNKIQMHSALQKKELNITLASGVNT